MKNINPFRHTIFWADDDADDLELFKDILVTHAPEHEVVQFHDGRQLLNHLYQTPQKDFPCLIVLDMNMPVLRGRETLSLVKKEPAFRDIPVVAFTTSISPVDKQVCDQFQTEMITKPISYDQMVKTVQSLVEICNQS